MDGDFDVRAVTCQRLVHRVVHHFPDQVVQAGGRGRADVHRRALADRLQVAEDLNAGGVVVVPRRGGGCLAALLCLRGSFLPGFSCLGHFLPTPRVANSRAAGEKTRSVSRPAGSVSGSAGAGGRILYSNPRDAASEQVALAFLFWAPLGRLPNKLFYQTWGWKSRVKNWECTSFFSWLRRPGGALPGPGWSARFRRALELHARLRWGLFCLLQPHGHDDVAVLVAFLTQRAHLAGGLVVLELEADGPGGGCAQKIQQVGGVKSDLHRLTVVGLGRD